MPVGYFLFVIYGIKLFVGFHDSPHVSPDFPDDGLAGNFYLAMYVFRFTCFSVCAAQLLWPRPDTLRLLLILYHSG